MAGSNQQNEKPRWPVLSIRHSGQPLAALITALSLGAIGAWCLWQWSLGGQLIDIDRAPPVAIDFRIDINEADWPEIALLPNIGEQLAKRIVADRAQNGPFRDSADLRRVRGIGPRTLESIEPFLVPLSDVAATAGSRKAPAPQVNK